MTALKFKTFLREKDYKRQYIVTCQKRLVPIPIQRLVPILIQRLIPILIQRLVLIPIQIYYEQRHFILNQNITFPAFIQTSHVQAWLFPNHYILDLPGAVRDCPSSTNIVGHQLKQKSNYEHFDYQLILDNI